MKTLYYILAIICLFLSIGLWLSADCTKGHFMNIPTMFQSIAAFISFWGFILLGHTTQSHKVDNVTEHKVATSKPSERDTTEPVTWCNVLLPALAVTGIGIILSSVFLGIK